MRQHVIERYVDSILADKALNIPALPDFLERQLYIFVIRIIFDNILNGVYCGLDGLKILGHRLEVELVEGTRSFDIPKASNINRQALMDLVGLLLKDKELNIPWLPDAVEAKLFYNVMLLVFTCLQSIAGTLSMDLAGHSVELMMGSNGKGLDPRLIAGMLKKSTVSDADIDALVDEQFNDCPNGFIPNPLERRMFRSLYLLILRAIQLLVSDTSLNLMSDRLQVRLRPDRVKLLASKQNSEPLYNNDDSLRTQKRFSVPDMILAATAGASLALICILLTRN
jgi:hypothetical protein